MVFDETHDQIVLDPDFNITGWTSSYSGEPIRPEQMHEWVDHTVARIQALRPKRVLEIGCGTGLLLVRLAPDCSTYLGTDFSPVVLAGLQRHLANRLQALPQITLAQRKADDFSGIDARSFDLVLLNSVVQYFPSPDYLQRVLEGAVEAVSDGGAIFMGDVRSLPLLATYHLAVELYQADDELSLTELQQRVQQRASQEEELVLDPAFFRALAELQPRISSIEVRPKRGWHHNELTQFRYDVILHVGDSEEAQAEVPWLDWQPEMTVPELQRILEEEAPDVLGLRRVANRRLERELQAQQLLSRGTGLMTVGELRAVLQQDEGIAPMIEAEELWALGEKLPYNVTVSWSEGYSDGYFDVIFQRRRENEGDVPEGSYAVKGKIGAPLTKPGRYANNPLQVMRSRKLVPELQQHAKEHLPEYMVPGAYVVLEKMPLTPNGKLDRRALPAPEHGLRELQRTFVAPRNAVEKVLAGIWAEVLTLERVGVHDDFFELGGHSLLATQLVTRVRKALQVELPLRLIFEASTVSTLAEALLHDPAQSARVERVAELLLQIARLSENEVSALLAGRQSTHDSGAK